MQSERDKKGAGLADEDVETIHYWIYSPGDGACKWDEFCKRGIMGLGWSAIGDLSQYASKDEMKTAMKAKIDPTKTYKNDAHATWQFLREMKPGDVVFAKRACIRSSAAALLLPIICMTRQTQSIRMFAK